MQAAQDIVLQKHNNITFEYVFIYTSKFRVHFHIKLVRFLEQKLVLKH